MRILIIQLTAPMSPPARPEFDHDLGVARAILQADGFDVAFASMTGYDGDLLRQIVSRHRPTHVMMDIPPVQLTAARHIIVDLSEKLSLPVIAVGQVATCRPDLTISIPTVTALVRGEYPLALPALFRSLRDGLGPGEDTPGVWFNSEEGLIRNDPAPLPKDCDALPFPDREMFDYAGIVADSGEAEFRATLGCANWCAHCLNDWYMEIYGGAESFSRRRSVGNVLDEIATVTESCEGVRRIAFRGHGFAADPDWLTGFAEAYPARFELPFRCHVRLNATSAPLAELLVRAGCDEVDVELGSGSNFIRQDVLGMRTSNRNITDGVAFLREAGLRVRGRVFVGAPYESEVSVQETLDLLCMLQLDDVGVRVFYPIPGTRAAEICAENGWISGRSDESFFANRSVLDMPALPAERIDEIAQRFDALLKRVSGRGITGRLRTLKDIATRPMRLFRRKK